MTTIKSCIVALLLTTSALCGMAQGATSPFTSPDWSAATSVSDETGTASSYDISKAWHLYDQQNSTHYFRVDLNGAISQTTSYGIYIDRDNIVTTGGTTPAGSGIENYLASDYVKRWDTAEGRWQNQGFVETQAGSWLDFKFSTQNDGSTLEWKFTRIDNKWDFGTTFSWMAGTIDGNHYDTTSKVATTPIPGAAWLLCSGILGLVGLKRRSETG